MNTKSKQDTKKNQGQKSRQAQTSKKQRHNVNLLQDEQKHHEQEHPETRLTR
jgi:hypothetical protein